MWSGVRRGVLHPAHVGERASLRRGCDAHAQACAVPSCSVCGGAFALNRPACGARRLLRQSQCGVSQLP
eukprot:1442088-Prymnesium_polylepis.1